MLHTNRLIPSIHLLHHGAKTVLFLLEIIKQRDSGCFGLGLYHIYCVSAVRWTPCGAEGVEMRGVSILPCAEPGSMEHIRQFGNVLLCTELYNAMCQSGSPHFWQCCWTWLTMCNVSLPTVHCKTSWVPSPIISFVNCGHWHPTSAMIVLRIIETTLERVY